MFGTLNTFLRSSMFCLMLFSISVHADILDDILERGTVRVGVSLFEPWTMKDKSGQLSGFEVDVVNKLAQDMGVKPEFKLYKWEEIIPALKKGEIDVIVAGMAITPARALKINFSLPYADSGITPATNSEKTKDIKKLEELNSQKIIIAVMAETVSFKLAKQLFNKANVMAFKTSDEAEKAVVQGAAHAYLAGMPQPRFLALRHPDKVDYPLESPLLTFKAGMAVKKGEQEWLNFLNSWVTARQADKWLTATHKYWFRSLPRDKGASQ